MPRTYTNLLYHIVFSTKERYPFIRPEFRDRLYEYIGGTTRGLKGICLEIGGVDDHIHMITKLPPTRDVWEFLEKLKPSVTNWARPIIHPKFEWQNGFGAFSIGESQIPAVRRYIQSQEEHHKKISFEDEFKKMLRQANVEFDERFLWK